MSDPHVPGAITGDTGLGINGPSDEIGVVNPGIFNEETFTAVADQTHMASRDPNGPGDQPFNPQRDGSPFGNVGT
jgi:hypothetical protein